MEVHGHNQQREFRTSITSEAPWFLLWRVYICPHSWVFPSQLLKKQWASQIGTNSSITKNLGLSAINLLLMGLGRNTPLHWNAIRIHPTSHPCLRCYIISRHALRLHPLHATYCHLPRDRSHCPSMSTRHGPRNYISRWYLLHRIREWVSKYHSEHKHKWHAHSNTVCGGWRLVVPSKSVLVSTGRVG